MANLFDNFNGQSNYYSGNATHVRDVHRDAPPATTASRMIEREDAPACEVKLLDSNPLWYSESAITRGIVQFCGSFMMVLTSLLIMVSYDAGVSPMTSSLAVALPYFLVMSICPSYHFNPALTIIGGLIPMTPCDLAPDPSADKSFGPTMSPLHTVNSLQLILMHSVWRLCYDVLAQVSGSIFAAVLVWQVMNMSGTDIISRFDAQVRDDIAKDPHGGMKVFWYVFIFSCMFSIVYYGIRYADRKTTCISVQSTLNPIKIGIISAAYFLFTAALAPILGVGGLNTIISIGPAFATAVAPIFYQYVAFGQLLGFAFIASVFRFIVYRRLHTCGCTFVKPLHAKHIKATLMRTVNIKVGNV